MSANGDAARRDMRAGRIERCPASGMDIGERRPLRKVSKSVHTGGSPFSMSAFARWFAVHPVQAFVWLYAHIEPMSMPACSSAAATSPAGVPRDASGCARAGATVATALPAVAPPRLLGGFAGSGRRFRHGSGLLCGFRRGLFAVGLADLGKRRRRAAFRADSACETAQKLRAGFACVGSCAS